MCPIDGILLNQFCAFLFLLVAQMMSLDAGMHIDSVSFLDSDPGSVSKGLF